MDDAQVSRAPKITSAKLASICVSAGALLIGTYVLSRTMVLEPEPDTIVAPSPTTLVPTQNDKQQATTAQQRKKDQERKNDQATLTPPDSSDVTQSKPKITSSGSPETGRASWYKLQAVTASGEAMDGDALTAAHPSLPIGTRVLVENLDNGRSIVVRINDRGPFTHNRIIDLSEAAAEQLDMIADGVANVRVSRVDEPVSITQGTQ